MNQTTYLCPICNTKYKEKTTTCSCCGFDGIEYLDYFNQKCYEEYERKSLFRPEEKYTVPRSVEKIQNYAFFFTKHLKKLYIHKGTQIDNYSFCFDSDATPEIIYIN